MIEKDMLNSYEYQSDFARKYDGQGKAEGKLEGKIEGKVEAALRIARHRGLELSVDLVARIESANDAAQLEDLIDRLVTASDEQAVRIAIELFGNPP